MSASDRDRVEATMDEVRAGVRQRQAEMATLDADLATLPASLSKVIDIQYVEEPQTVSHRPVIGPVIVAAKSLVYKAFMRWFMLDVIEQQNAFNRATADALRDLFERQKRLAKSAQRLEERVTAADRHPEAEG